MKLYQLGKEVYEIYCTKVKGNENSSHELAQKKLTRNIKLAMKVDIGNGTIMYMYGNLHIFVRGNKITWIKNIKLRHNWFYKDMNKYNELNELLGINRLEEKQVSA